MKLVEGLLLLLVVAVVIGTVVIVVLRASVTANRRKLRDRLLAESKQDAILSGHYDEWYRLRAETIRDIERY